MSVALRILISLFLVTWRLALWLVVSLLVHYKLLQDCCMRLLWMSVALRILISLFLVTWCVALWLVVSLLVHYKLLRDCCMRLLWMSVALRILISLFLVTWCVALWLVVSLLVAYKLSARLLYEVAVDECCSPYTDFVISSDLVCSSLACCKSPSSL